VGASGDDEDEDEALTTITTRRGSYKRSSREGSKEGLGRQPNKKRRHLADQGPAKEPRLGGYSAGVDAIVRQAIGQCPNVERRLALQACATLSARLVR
jgi:hypothetical protein